MLVIIVLAYGVIIGLDETAAGGPGRLLLLGYLLGEAIQLSRASRQHQAPPTGDPAHQRWPRYAVWVGTLVAALAAVWAGVYASTRIASGVVGGGSLALTASIIEHVGMTVVRRERVDTPTVAGVLAVYLLLALLFASLNQFLAAFDPDHYLHGVTGLPTASDQLYFSVITMATVGYGDIVPGSQVARAIAVVEALTGQLYLVSVVAAVVGGWQRGRD